MEAELIKEHVITSYPSAKLNLTVLAEGETIVPDTKKDVAEIICVEARSFIDKTEIQNGRIIFTGVAEFTVLYKAEGDYGISSLSTKIPFNHIEECASVTPEDKFSVHHETLHSECFLLNSRKLSLKSVISVGFSSYLDIAIPVVTDIKCSDIELKKEPSSFSHLSACIEECFTVSDFLNVPASSPPLETSLLCRVSVNDCSVKAVTGKAVVKGSLAVFHLYLTPDGTVCHMQHDIPFTEIIDVPALSEDSLYDMNFHVKKFTIEEDKSSEESQLFTFSADICLSATAFSTSKILAVTDAYIPGQDTGISFSNCKKSEILSIENTTLTIKDTLNLPMEYPPMEQVCPLSARITGLETKAENGKIIISGKADVDLTYLSSDGKAVNTLTHELSFREEFSSPSKNPLIYAKATISHIDFNIINQAKLELRLIAGINLTISEATDDFPSIGNLFIGERCKNKRPSIVIYFVKSGDTLWDIAKRYGTTADKIITANNMDKGDILNIGMRLLIPA